MIFEAALCRIPEARGTQTQDHMNDSYFFKALQEISGGELSTFTGTCQVFLKFYVGQLT